MTGWELYDNILPINNDVFSHYVTIYKCAPFIRLGASNEIVHQRLKDIERKFKLEKLIYKVKDKPNND